MPLWAAAKGDRSVGGVSGSSHDIGNMHAVMRALDALPAVRRPEAQHHPVLWVLGCNGFERGGRGRSRGQDSPCLRAEKRGAQREAHSARVVASKCSRSCHPCSCSSLSPVLLGCCSTRRFEKTDLKYDPLGPSPLVCDDKKSFLRNYSCGNCGQHCAGSSSCVSNCSLSAWRDHHVRLSKAAPLGASGRGLSCWLQLYCQCECTA